MNTAPLRKALVVLAILAAVFPLTAAPVSAQTEPHITVRTFGWGHGVGMGQWGAQGMAQGGSSYQQILSHFYTGTTIGSAPSTAQWNDVRVRIRSTDSAVHVYAEGNVTLVVPSGTSGGNLAMVNGENVQINTEGSNLVARVYGTNGQQRATRSVPNSQSPWFAVRLNGNVARTHSDAWGGNSRYRHGDIIVHGNRPDGCHQHCVGIRGLHMDQYLNGLAEVPGDWHTNALRAQAVAARSFAAPRIASRQGNLFHLVDSVQDQAYKGTGGTGGGWPTAVTATTNQVLLHNGQVASGYYSASTGGHTENSEYVWAAAVPWARAVPDPGDDAASPHRHTYTYTQAELAAWFGVQNVTDVRIVGNIGASGRTNRADVRITGNTTRTLSANEFRQIINARAGSNRQIITTNFRVDSSGLGVAGDQLATATGVALADRGYWITNQTGAVSAREFAPFHGSMAGRPLNAPVLGMAANPPGTGYWLVAADGGIFTFGNARFFGSTGSMRLNQPVVGMASTHTGNGYWLVARDGGIFSFGDARFHGSTGSMRLNQPVVGMARSADGNGYWLVARDGGIFAFGNARFHGSLPGLGISTNVVAMAPTPTGNGYWMLSSDGGVFSFGDARFYGSIAGSGKQAVGMAPTSTGNGYWVVASDGSTFRFGDA